MAERDFKGIWIPKEIWLNEDLSFLDKVILMEVDSLDNENHCIAGNDYLAKFCQCSESAVTKSIKKLKEFGYVEQISFDGRHRVLKTNLQSGIVNLTSESSKFYDAESSNLRGYINNNIDNIYNTDININNKNNIYSADFDELATKWQPNGNQMETQYRLDKSRLDKDRVNNIYSADFDGDGPPENTVLNKKTTVIDYDGLKKSYEDMYRPYPKKTGNKSKGYEIYRQWITKGRKVDGHNLKLTAEQIDKAVKKYIRQQEEYSTDIKYYKNIETLMNNIYGFLDEDEERGKPKEPYITHAQREKMERDAEGRKWWAENMED